ncbi:response regulator transcription factor [Noviherbaspirillum agri]
MAHLIIVEDNLPYAEEIADFLEDAGHHADIAGDGATMWSLLMHQRTDVILLDLGLPDDSGFNIIPRLRELHPETGIIVLTARVMLDSRILGLQLGADNYLTKPIKFKELAAHIEALCRRVGGRTQHEAGHRWSLHREERRLRVGDASSVDLTEKEFKMLHMLAMSTRPIPRDSLIVALAGDNHADTKKMDMLVYRLRKKVRSAVGAELPLRSAYGEGYSLSVPICLH